MTANHEKTVRHFGQDLGYEQTQLSIAQDRYSISRADLNLFEDLIGGGKGLNKDCLLIG
jgi:hypothetical protein